MTRRGTARPVARVGSTICADLAYGWQRTVIVSNLCAGTGKRYRRRVFECGFLNRMAEVCSSVLVNRCSIECVSEGARAADHHTYGVALHRNFYFLVLVAVGFSQVVPTPAPHDIPQPVPANIGLAGDSRPDIARFLNVRSARGSSLSPDGRFLSYITSTSGHPQLWVVGTQGGVAPQQLTFGESSITFQEWSPEGPWIIYGTDQAGNEREGFYLIRPDGLQEREVLPPSDAFRVFGGWSPDGRQIAFSSTERNGRDFDIYSSTFRRVVHPVNRGEYMKAREGCISQTGGQTGRRCCSPRRAAKRTTTSSFLT